MAAFHEQSMDLVVVGYTWTHLQTIKRDTFQEVTTGRNSLKWPFTAEEYKVVARVGAGCAHLKHIYQGMCPKLSWAQAQPDGGYSTLGTTAEDRTSLFFIYCLMSIYPLIHNTPESILGLQETVEKKLHLYVFMLAKFHNTWLHG